MSATGRFLSAHRPRGSTLVLVGLLLSLEVLFAVVYVVLTRTALTRPLMVIGVPMIWLNLSLLVFLRIRPPEAARSRWPALLVAAGYFALLAVLGGLVVLGDGNPAAGLRVTLSGVPGWVPLVVADAGPAALVVVPFKLVGYVALAYLVYVAVLDAGGALFGSAVGLFSCVSCTFPLVAGLVSTITGGGATAAAVYSGSYPLSTAVFAVTVGLLAWRPTAADLRRLRSRLSR
jgi:hypothetical protein